MVSGRRGGGCDEAVGCSKHSSHNTPAREHTLHILKYTDIVSVAVVVVVVVKRRQVAPNTATTTTHVRTLTHSTTTHEVGVVEVVVVVVVAVRSLQAAPNSNNNTCTCITTHTTYIDTHKYTQNTHTK